MTKTSVSNHDHHHHEQETRSKVLFGFWCFILSDFILFAALFASYAVLKDHTYGAAGIQQIATLPYVLVMTLVILGCSLTAGIMLHAAKRGSKGGAMFWLLVTFILGLVFAWMDYSQLAHLYATGNTWQKSAFLSIFFTLIGVNLFHFAVALLWMFIVFFQTAAKGVSFFMETRLKCLTLFINFLNIVWVFVFIIVYMMGAI